jgi:GST-like protein
MLGQNHHFSGYAPEKLPMLSSATGKKSGGSMACSTSRLADRKFVAGAYSIADMAAYPWIVPHQRQGQDLDDFPNLTRWF